MSEQSKAVRARLAELEAANGGRLTPAAVVADAKDPQSPLHRFFQWDIEKAAEQHWLDQARNLITSVKVVHRTENTFVRSVYYVRDPTAELHEPGYVSIPTLRSDRDLAHQALAAEFSRVADLLRRAREIGKAIGAEDEIEALLQNVVGMRQRLMEAPAQSQ